MLQLSFPSVSTMLLMFSCDFYVFVVCEFGVEIQS